MNSPVSGEGQVTVSFTDEPNATRTFFDPTSMIEAREKSLPSISLFCFNTDGSLTVRHRVRERYDPAQWLLPRSGLAGQTYRTGCERHDHHCRLRTPSHTDDRYRRIAIVFRFIPSSFPIVSFRDRGPKAPPIIFAYYDNPKISVSVVSRTLLHTGRLPLGPRCARARYGAGDDPDPASESGGHDPQRRWHRTGECRARSEPLLLPQNDARSLRASLPRKSRWPRFAEPAPGRLRTACTGQYGRRSGRADGRTTGRLYAAAVQRRGARPRGYRHVRPAKRPRGRSH